MSPSSSTNGALAPNSKLRQLKDRMWVRETLEDITAAEFATSLSVERDSEEVNSEKKEKKRAVDFENILSKLDARIEEMCVLSSPEIAKKSNQICYVLNRRIVDHEDAGNTIIENTCYSLTDEIGMGSVVYTKEQREALLKSLIGTREKLVNFIEGGMRKGDDVGGNDDDDIDAIRSQLQTDDIPSSQSSSGKEESMFDPSLYVRDDGTVDWDGALQDKEALKKFGSAVWSRINGQDPEEANGEEEEEKEPSLHTHAKAVTAKIDETEAIREKRQELDMLVDKLQRMEIEHTKLLNSAIDEGYARANVNLATVNAPLRQRIRESSEELETMQSQVSFQTLNYELERIYTYLERELGNTAAKGYIPLQDRLNVAEFGLLESQVDSFNRQIEFGESLDSDVLAVVTDQLVEFKRRLGIDYYVAGLTFDSEAIQVWLKDIWEQTKSGFTFYVKGTRLFVDDVVFCSSLVLRALQGYTLKPREVRTLRRTFKDTITFIPVVIILLIPLTPIGHVLVFGAIQRVFPGFFPSCFTEQRQNLLALYESTEYTAVTINETWQQQLVRVSQAIRVLVIRLFRKIWMSLGGDLSEKSNEISDNDQSL